MHEVEVRRLTRDGKGVTTEARQIYCDMVLSSGGWQPTVHLFSQSRGKLKWNPDILAFVPDKLLPGQNNHSVGAARGAFNLGDCLLDGHAAGAAAASAAGCSQPAGVAPVAAAEPLRAVATVTKARNAQNRLRIARIGYQLATVDARVGDETVRVPITEMVVKLDAVVVTGTVGESRTRSLGNAVGSADVSKALALTGRPAKLQDMLSSSIPGVRIMRASGSIGSGGTTRIRGAGSLSLSNEPLIYIDGVRSNNQAAAFSYAFNGAQEQPSRINDLNPDEIESIEILKGPSAATIYGTEASNGVIQIFTRRDGGASRFTALAAPLAAHPRVRNFRNLGMIWAFEVEPAEPGFAMRAFEAALARGVLLRPIGNTVYFMPPYIIEEEHMRALVDGTLAAIDAALAGA